MYELHFEILLRYVDPMLNAVVVTVGISLASIIIGSALGLAIALARTSQKVILVYTAAAYVNILRNIPLLLVLIFVYFVFPIIGIRGIDKYQSAVIALSLYAAAYLSEIFRAGLEAVQTRYVEAAKSIGLSKYQTFTNVIFPIMIGEVLPALGNNFVSLFKDSSLAAAISVPEITFVGRQINTDTFRVIEAWTAVALVYLVVGFLLTVSLRRLEMVVVRWR
jgi:His/Glu/Gln/Arg/opine family amino acid ABC transporter permease subunit